MENTLLGPSFSINEKALVNISEKYSKERVTSDDEEEAKQIKSSVNLIPI